MTIDFERLKKEPKLLLEASLKPIQGERFQPTGFADLGAARYALADGTEMLLIESAQSVANRMELTCCNDDKETLLDELKGLPFIEVFKADGSLLTSSILEAHRINSEYIMKTDFKETFTKEIGYRKDLPVNWTKLYRALLKYDINSLIHGTFLEEIAGRLRITRALSGFIEARNVQVAENGGVKFNRVQPDLKGGEGNVPFHRTEFTAESITAYFNLDLALLRGYKLDDDATNLLIALSLFKIQRFLSTGLRLRTACDFDMVGNLTVTRPNDFAVASEESLLEECRKFIIRCRQKNLFATPAITKVNWSKPTSSKKEKKTEIESDLAGVSEN